MPIWQMLARSALAVSTSIELNVSIPSIRPVYGGDCLIALGPAEVLSEEIRRSEFSTGDRELGRPELTPLGKCSGAVELFRIGVQPQYCAR